MIVLLLANAWSYPAHFVASPSVALDRPFPRQLAAIDIDGDGWTDLVVGPSTTRPVVHWNEQGILGPATPIPTVLRGARPAAVDIDADGRRDLCLGGNHWNASDLHCFAVEGHTLAEETYDDNQPNDYLQPFDHDDDGVEGLLTSSYTSLTMLEPDGQGGVEEIELASVVGAAFTNPVVVDLDLDGDLDLVVVDRLVDGLLWMERSNGLLLDLAPVTGGMAANGWIEAIEDVDGDGVLDVIIDDWGGLQRWSGDGQGGVSLTGTMPGFDAVVADLDGSGVADALGFDESSGLVALMPELSGVPLVPTALPAGTPLATADFDRDGILDVVIDAGGLVVVSDPLGAAWEHRLHVDRRNAKIAAGSLDDDAFADVVYGNAESPGVFFVPTLPALGRDVFGAPVGLAGADEGIRDLALIDLDRDGHLDVVHADVDDVVRWHPGGSNIPGPALALPGSSAGVLIAADLDGDGADELVTADLAGLLHIYDDDGLGGIVRSATTLTVPDLSDGDGGDLDGDGLEDLVLARDGAFSQLRSTGTDLLPIAGAQRPNLGTVAIGDPGGDGYLDAVAGSVCPLEDRHEAFGCFVDKIWRAPHDATTPGQLQAPKLHTYPYQEVRGPVVVTDWDGDGTDDLIAANNRDGGLAFLRKWLLPVSGSGWSQIYEATPADLDADGDDDLVVATYAGIGVVWNDTP